MTLKIILPSAKTDQINIKDAILGILGERFPLSIRDLFKIVNNEYNLKVTYQGVRKAVNYLEEANVLVKHELKYEIKREWIQNCDTFIKRLQQNYFHQKGQVKQGITAKNYKEFHLETLFDLDNFWYSIIVDYIKTADNVSKKAIAITGHQWWMLINLGSETRLMQTIKECGYKQYILCAHQNPLNEWALAIYKKFGFPTKIVKRQDTTDINVYGNLVVEVFYSKEILADIEKCFQSAKTIKEIDTFAVHNLAHKKTELTIKIFDDAAFAESLRSKVLNKF
ncbi:MAG TPA: hypothetical protein VJK72_05730 [Candidatus Nanoarchaeia archaeon]|nr:hypothetical protein [Candidatus Nanoarchaeia archaeon]